MGQTVFNRMYSYIASMLVYQPPRTPTPFVLDEFDEEKERQSAYRPTAGIEDSAKDLAALLRYARRLEAFMERAKEAISRQDEEKILQLAAEYKKLEAEQKETSPVAFSYNNEQKSLERLISTSLEENKKNIEAMYHLPDNKDIVVRDFVIPGDRHISAMLVFVDGMIDKKVINLSVLQPLMLLDGLAGIYSGDDLLKYIVDEALPSEQAKPAASFREVAEGINSGDTALFIDGLDTAVLIETKGYEHRGVDRPQNEQSVRGSQAAFAEALRVNTALIRTIFPSNDLVTEIIKVGNRVPLKCAIMYLKTIANPHLVAEVKRRIKGVSTDYITDMGVLEQFIEDHPRIPLPQVLSTERPDRVAASLAEGRLALILEGTPFVHILPVSFFTFFHSSEDFSLKFPAGSFMRLLRLLGTILSVTLPAGYLAISYFHQEALPTELVLAIAASREKVPFPAIFEILLMEFSFELIREAGIRIPGVLGSTIGIVGAIILGQAAVSANLVSPIMVVVIAITGLASFSIPDYRMALALRMLRFVFLALATTLGLVGMAIGLLVSTVMLCNMKSVGVPYLAPIGPKTVANLDVVIRGPVYNQERRPDSLNTKDMYRQPKISRKWTRKAPEGEQQ